MTEQKPDAAYFRQRLDRLKEESWLGSSRRWWPDYLFHHSDIENVVDILKSNELLSRLEMESKPNFLDSASPDIIEKTDTRWKGHVRFYFRPRTPTFFHIEGFRPKHRQQLHAHCPVPVYLLFDLKEIICRVDSKFSSGTLAGRNKQVFSTAKDFAKLPFQYIYHDESFPPDQRDTIVFHRHAEVIVP